MSGNAPPQGSDWLIIFLLIILDIIKYPFKKLYSLITGR